MITLFIVPFCHREILVMKQRLLIADLVIFKNFNLLSDLINPVAQSYDLAHCLRESVLYDLLILQENLGSMLMSSEEVALA